jgi:U3 small nucleolar RNA-associated protein 5
MPDLVARLSGLHAILTTRLALQESLLSLSGRLDMVLSQIEMRSSAAPAPLALQKGKQRSGAQGKEVKRYVEGESEDEQMDVEVEVDSGEDGGSVEDVELGGDSVDEEEEDSSEEEDEDEDDEEDSEEGGPTMNGFIDDEAEEYSDDEEEDSE